MSALHVALLFAAPDGPSDGITRAAPALLGAEESEIVDRLRANDEAAYAHVYAVFYPRLVAVASDMVPTAIAEEIAQDVLVLLWDRRAAWPPTRGIATYLYTAARNRARDHARHQGVVGRVVSRGIDMHESIGAGEQAASPDLQVEQADLGRAFVRTVAQLPEKTRTAFTLRWVHQLGYPEIAEILGVSEIAARKQVSRARETLLTRLQAYLR